MKLLTYEQWFQLGQKHGVTSVKAEAIVLDALAELGYSGIKKSHENPHEGGEQDCSSR